MPRALHLNTSDDGVAASEALRLLDAAAQQNASALLLYGKGAPDIDRMQRVAAGLMRCGIRQILVLQEHAETASTQNEEAPQ